MGKRLLKRPAGVFFTNTLYRILAFFISLLLWFSLVHNRVVTKAFHLPVRYSGLQESLVIAAMDPEEVTVRVEARGSDIIKLMKKELYYEVKLNGFEKGKYELSLDKRNIMGTENLSLFQISERHDSIRVVIDEKEEKYVPIRIVSRGTPPKGYKLMQPIIVTPSVVKVRGPKSVGILETYPLDLEGMTESFSKEVTLDIPENTTLLRDEEDKIFARIEIVKLKTAEVRDIPVRVTGSYSLIFPRVVSLKFEVPVSMETEALRESISVSLDLRDYEKGTYNLVPEIGHPEAVSLIDLDPSSIQVIIE
ncbi:MAG TPA: CdaR family protein [Candidatus Mcinerneyibacteriales bacterium]|nr:CdaR family protein [Candidatus Mcinerneyibacteriales bacterium]HPE20354.1 CdaR family protein [Candidatus Mcinerneyibacteriales bacterium]HPJ69481.1 CdaR family protein [Candidatus Mcinerneyibacteriales bacterium]HPQ88484.1 CdaR family protein [Candidatus Mcinerneyibacteriales bacterium]